METLHISDKTFSYQDFATLLSTPVRIRLDKKSKLKIKKSYDHLVNILSKGETIYGVNTGFGKLSQVKINKEDQNKLQINLIKSPYKAGVQHDKNLRRLGNKEYIYLCLKEFHTLNRLN